MLGVRAQKDLFYLGRGLFYCPSIMEKRFFVSTTLLARLIAHIMTTNASDFTPRLTYGSLPWLVSVDVPEGRACFIAHGQPKTFKRGDCIAFGLTGVMHYIESGLVGTMPVSHSTNERIMGLFGWNTTLGLVMALRNNTSHIALVARALTDVTTRAMDTTLFQEWFDAQHPIVQQSLWQNAIAKAECQLEGAYVNDICSVLDRLLWCLWVIYCAAPKATSKDLAKEPYDTLPITITLTDMALIIHTTREMASRALAQAHEAGWVKKEGRRLWLNVQKLPAYLASLTL